MQAPNAAKLIRLSDYVTDKLGLPRSPTSWKELEKPGRDPRGPFKPFSFAEGVSTMGFKQGMKLPGIVTNITAFGAFVDIGVHQDGLVHISQLANRFVRDPNEVVKLHQEVLVTVLDVDIPQAHFLDDARRIEKKGRKRRGSGMLSLCVMNPKERNSWTARHTFRKVPPDRSDGHEDKK